MTHSQSQDDNSGDSTSYFFTYKDFEVYFGTTVGFYYFISLNPSTRICTKDIPGGIGIGDSVEKFRSLDVYNWKELDMYYDEYTQKTGGSWYIFSRTTLKADTELCMVLVKDGVIIGFQSSLNDED